MRVVRLDRTGPPERRFDLVVLADGFTTGELDGFVRTTQAIRQELRSTPPFSTLRGVINLTRVDRVGPGDIVLGTELEDARLLRVDEQRAVDVARRHTEGPDAVLVVVNRRAYGGFGGDAVAAVTIHHRAGPLALHELGHAAFDLADEYGGNEEAVSGPGEPHRVNVSRVGDPRLVKWRDLIGSEPEVGCHEGGDRTTYGVYRPSTTCRMRSLRAPFCPVCHREIARRLIACALATPPQGAAGVPQGRSDRGECARLGQNVLEESP